MTTDKDSAAVANDVVVSDGEAMAGMLIDVVHMAGDAHKVDRSRMADEALVVLDEIDLLRSWVVVAVEDPSQALEPHRGQ